MMFEGYKNYKDSEIEWLGDIPSEWEVKRNKYVFQEITNLSETGTEALLTVSHITGVTLRSEKNVNMFFAKTMKGYKKCKVGDLLINTMWAWMGALGTSNNEGICSPAYGVYRNNKYVDYEYRYFDYLYKIPSFIIEMTRYSKGIVASRLRLYPREFLKIETVLPSFETQQKIATYLDTQTQKIDKEITLLEEKIKKYKELKQTLINETVLRGLDKDVELKDSGVEWVGAIPSHWEVKRLKYFGTIETSSINKKIEMNETIVKIINFTDVYKSTTKELFNNKNYMKVSANSLQLREKKLKKGDILFTPSSETIEDIAISAVVLEDLENTLYSYHLLRLRCTKYIYIDFKKYLFNNHTAQYYFSKSAKGITRKILGLNTFYSLEVSIPPLKEQIEIANYLNNKTNQIEQIIKTIETKIKLQKEFRKTLINDVVTGKVKV